MERFARFAALVGADKLERLQRCHVVVFGVGGVGSHLAEALARAGVGHVTLVDFDTVAIHNINRQLHALSSTVGRAKVEVMAERLRDIAPRLTVNVHRTRVDDGNVAAFLAADVDYVADAIDDVPAKLAIIQYCKAQGLPFLCAMGTGNKLDPTKLEIGDLSRTEVCPLCRSVRQKLRKCGITEGVPVVWSRETPQDTSVTEDGHRAPASSPWLPASAGLLMAAHIVENL